MGKKGGKGKGGKGGKGGKAGGWQPIAVPDEPLMVRAKVGTFLTVVVRGVVWRAMDFTERVPASMKVFELHSMIRNRHGGGVVEFTLYKEEVRTRTRTHCAKKMLLCCSCASAEKTPRIVSRPLLSAHVRLQKHQRNKLDDMSASLGSLEFSSTSADAERVFYYEFEPRVDDCPLLLCAPHNLRIEAMVTAEKDAERAAQEAREAKLASMKKKD